MSIIIVEGVNCSGKSTLINSLVKIFMIDSFNERSSNRFFNNIQDVNVRDITAEYCLFIELEFAKKFSYIADRFHISEKVYRIIEGRDISYFDEIEDVLLTIPHLLILCKPQYDMLLTKTIERDGVVRRSLFAEYNLFDEIYRLSRLNKVILETY